MVLNSQDPFLKAIPVLSFKRSAINHAIRTEHGVSAPSSLLGKDLFLSLPVAKLWERAKTHNGSAAIKLPSSGVNFVLPRLNPAHMMQLHDS